MAKTALQVLNERAQGCVAAFPVIILGSGASIAAGIPGMAKLREHLLSLPDPAGLTSDESASWTAFKTALGKVDLESALQQVNLPEKLDDAVVEATWQYLHPHDIRAFDELLKRRTPYPLTLLFQHLLRSTNQELNVVTPNYDRIAEYAAEIGSIYHETGFSYGHMRWRIGDPGHNVQVGGQSRPRVSIHKVHGSFEWVRDDQGTIRALPISHPHPEGWKRTIVTPGLRKYERTYDEPFVSIKASCDRAFSTANAFLCSGFGFNDNHIQTKIRERFRTRQVPLVLITHKVTPTAHTFIKNALCSQYLAVEYDHGGCRIYCPEYPDGATLEGPEFWQLEHFLKLVST